MANRRFQFVELLFIAASVSSRTTHLLAIHANPEKFEDVSRKYSLSYLDGLSTMNSYGMKTLFLFFGIASMTRAESLPCVVTVECTKRQICLTANNNRISVSFYRAIETFEKCSRHSLERVVFQNDSCFLRGHSILALFADLMHFQPTLLLLIVFFYVCNSTADQFTLVE